MKEQLNVRITPEAKRQLGLIAAALQERTGETLERLIRDAWSKVRTSLAGA